MLCLENVEQIAMSNRNQCKIVGKILCTSFNVYMKRFLLVAVARDGNSSCCRTNRRQQGHSRFSYFEVSTIMNDFEMVERTY